MQTSIFSSKSYLPMTELMKDLRPHSTEATEVKLTLRPCPRAPFFISSTIFTVRIEIFEWLMTSEFCVVHGAQVAALPEV